MARGLAADVDADAFDTDAFDAAPLVASLADMGAAADRGVDAATLGDFCETLIILDGAPGGRVNEAAAPD